MKYTLNPTVTYDKVNAVETEDAAAFVAAIEGVAPQTPVAWYSHKDEKAHPGVWLRRGMYRLKHGSFVDPSDLSAYAAQYYEPFSSGRHECVQIGRTPETATAPDGVFSVDTAADLVAAIRTLVGLPKLDENEAEEGGSVAEDSLEHVPENEAVAEAPAACALKLLQPDYAFEFHGALTRGWHAQFYTAEAEDGSQEHLIVLR